MARHVQFPLVRTVGFDGALVTFADIMSEKANCAALAFRSEVDGLQWDEVTESSASLGSTFVRFDTQLISHQQMLERLQHLLDQKDWYNTPLPTGRKLWRVPTVYGTDLAPQLDDAAAAAGLTPEEAIRRLGQSRVRVLTIGFAPGQPYLGPLGPEFNIPRLQNLTPMVPEGALVLAISQFVLFSGPTPTGWRHVGQTAFRCFRPERSDTFPLSPGDELLFTPVSREELEHIRATNTDGTGGAICEEIAP
ncbi:MULTISPECIES: allophanate hydrolase subunit 1 [unclassified Ruegeria]|uniref:5-oxoprolinase subunit B family protein n=1 Tax=unclassified Ruegeria TaxID=2625375 RepID=UPI001490C3E7|nr:MULTISPECIES: carboxyltransferase domain-containing protein [unclassified Ruegeria]NOD49937.1 carboxyltransferase domain-containing protein [Ruegeria sp. HKCCD5849]NOD54233.1 carboxyltransferase domain-containing protein [Ruegeria sp. HKCCD5851]NOD68927.1 carboxyltransferase domain-containing protein [Ruegeria sp. HKCCD7303]